MPSSAGRILALDTASAQCSVALLVGERLIARTAATVRDHARLLLPMVDAVLAEAGLALPGIDGIAFGRGPGSFTGLRIAAAVTQGLAAGANLPVLPVSDLRALAESARVAFMREGLPQAGDLLLACMDARMGEVYWGLFENGECPVGMAQGGERVSPPAGLGIELAGLVPAATVMAGAVGMGLAAYPELVTGLGLDPAKCLPRSEPHAAEIARLARFDLTAGARWLDPAAALPVYIRDRVAQAPL